MPHSCNPHVHQHVPLASCVRSPHISTPVRGASFKCMRYTTIGIDQRQLFNRPAQLIRKKKRLSSQVHFQFTLFKSVQVHQEDRSSIQPCDFSQSTNSRTPDNRQENFDCSLPSLPSLQWQQRLHRSRSSSCRPGPHPSRRNSDTGKPSRTNSSFPRPLNTPSPTLLRPR